MIRVFNVLNSLAPGGTEQSTVAVAPVLREHGVDVVIVTLREASDELHHIACGNGTEVVRVAPGSRMQQVRSLRELIRSRAPDVIHTALFDADIVGRLAAWRTGVPVVSSFVSTPYDPARLSDPNVRRWKLEFVRAIDAVTGRLLVDRFHAVSDGVRTANAKALHVPLDRITVAERGRDVVIPADTDDDVQDCRRQLGVSPGQQLLLSLGRQEYVKGHDDLVRSVPHLVTLGLDPIVAIAGREGNASTALRQLIESIPEVYARVRVLGHRSDVDRLLAAADVLVISSRLEGTAGVALEAMAVGTPIVSTDLQGVRGVLVHDRNAILVPVADPEALARGVARVVSDDALRTAVIQRGRADYDERFTLDAGAARMAAIYADVVRR